MDWSHPLSIDLYALFLFNEGSGRWVNDLGPRKFSQLITGNAGFVPLGMGGGGLGGAAAITDYVAIPAKNAWKDFTFVMLYTPKVIGVNEPIMGVLEPPGNPGANADNTIYQTASDQWVYNVYIGGNKFLATPTGIVKPGRTVHITVGVGRGTMQMYINGQSPGTTAAASAYNGYGASPKLTFLSGYATAVKTGTGTLHYAAVYDRLLTQEEAVRHQANPYGNLI